MDQGNLKLVTLGRASLSRDGQGEILGPGVPLSILTYLACATRRTASRGHLADVFWGDSDQTKGRQALRQNLTRLRLILGHGAFQDLRDQVHLTVPLLLDLDGFVTAVNRGEFQAAIQAYTGAFLADIRGVESVHFEHWIDGQRERLRNLFVRAGEGLIRESLNRGRAKEVIALAEWLRREAPESESVHRILIESLLAARLHPQARQEADALASWLKEIGRPAEPATTRLMRIALEDHPRESLPEAPDTFDSDLVGRDREFQAIMKDWSEVRRTGLRHLHVEGQTGLGKTRLLLEVGRRFQAIGGRLAYARAHPLEKGLALSLVADLAAELAALPGGRAVPNQTASLLVGINPALGSVFPGAAVPAFGDDLPRQRIHALGDLIAAVAEQSPLALLLDDIHWMDDESRRLLAGVLPRLEKAPVLYLSAGRPGGLSGLFGHDCRKVLLGPLTLDDISVILTGLAQFESESMHRRVTAAFHRASNGSPLLLMESLHMAAEAGRLHRIDGNWSIPDLEEFLSWIATRNALEARLKTLSTPARKFLLTLAATGVPLARTDVDKAIESGSVSPDTLTELERRGYIEPKGNRWDLAHEQIGEALSRLAGDTERRQVHAALGRVLAERGVSDQNAARRAAHHLVDGGGGHELVALFRQWVSEARRRGDHTPAVELARDLLGERQAPDRVRLLVRSLPARQRWSAKAVALAIIVAALLVLGLFLF